MILDSPEVVITGYSYAILIANHEPDSSCMGAKHTNILRDGQAKYCFANKWLTLTQYKLNNEIA